MDPFNEAMGKTDKYPQNERAVFIVGSEHNNLKLKGKVLDHLKNAFSEESEKYAWDWKSFKTPEEAQLFLEKSPVPHLTLLGPCQEIPSDSHRWKDLCKGIHTLAPKTCVLALSNSDAPSGDEAIAWLDRGSNGLFNPDSHIDQSFSLLRELLTLPLKKTHTRHVRINSNHKITIRLSSFSQALASETMNIGTGGLFIRNVPPNVAIDDTVEFVLRFSNTVSNDATLSDTPDIVDRMNEPDVSPGISVQSSDISGEGRVVWIRQTAIGDLPEGIGIEFTQLSEEGNEKIQEFIAKRRVKAFIPKA